MQAEYMRYQRIELPNAPRAEHLKAAASDYQAVAITAMREIAQRYQQTPDYPFIDTKLSLITGENFPASDPIRGPQAIYGWIQGRGLEALARHARWIEGCGIDDLLAAQLRTIAREVMEQLRHMRARNAGRLRFFMFPDGQPFMLDAKGQPQQYEVTADSPYGFSDLFSSKGLFAAADYLGDAAARVEALAYIQAVEDAIWADQFYSDQISLDPKNCPEPRAGFHPHGPFMIQIGAVALLIEAGVEEAIERGLRLIEHELTTYANLDGRIPGLQEGDFWEGVDDHGQPFVEPDGVIVSDPGHSLEFVGLALKCIAAAQGRATPRERERLDAARRRMPVLLARNFDNGYLPGPQGLSKAFDLAARTHLNSDMPWWNLPETIRAAALCLVGATDERERAACLHIWRDCHNAFRLFTRTDLHLMAYQMRNADGDPVDAIPATSDADPGYHTGLSLIDVITISDQL